jgi:hypothetical protein
MSIKYNKAPHGNDVNFSCIELFVVIEVGKTHLYWGQQYYF